MPFLLQVNSAKALRHETGEVKRKLKEAEATTTVLTWQINTLMSGF